MEKDALSKLDKREVQRQQVIFEFITTEEQYVEDLRTIVDVSSVSQSVVDWCRSI